MFLLVNFLNLIFKFLSKFTLLFKSLHVNDSFELVLFITNNMINTVLTKKD